ncbi:alsin-like isoform X2 [Nilaparvata lugens]|uniref:alsin-like isoform X2 n=1 Tax=Nilaparvata lugens TaxID=108931 RepID=UPI00193E7845|nr:alsin-like isoform X2 [Nilaparvata lugens]
MVDGLDIEFVSLVQYGEKRTPQRRLLRDSKTHALTLHNASRFSNHWFILLSDAFVHISGATQTIHSLDTLWVEPAQDTDNSQNGLLITTPEDSLQLVAPSAHEKVDWMVALQDALKKRLSRSPVPTVRNASYTFTKHAPTRMPPIWAVGCRASWKARADWNGRMGAGMWVCSGATSCMGPDACTRPTTASMTDSGETDCRTDTDAPNTRTVTCMKATTRTV